MMLAVGLRARVLGAVWILVAVFVAMPARAQSLPSAWSTRDIGAVGAAGSASGSGTSFTVSGAGADVWGSADAFRFAYTALTGDGSITAQVTSLQPIADWTKAGVMMRDTLSAGSAHGFMLVSANKGLAFQRRVSANGLSSNTAGGAFKAPRWVRLTRSGNVITAFTSADGSTWSTVGSDTIPMASTIYVGLAVSSHVAGTLATANFANVTLTGQTGPPPSTIETLVFLRHGEKPSGGYGQLTCQGLQRALALPSVLTNRYGPPQYIFAPNPLPKIGDSAGSFDYVRPLATIEPTAIALGLPVNADFGYADIGNLQTTLTSAAFASSTIFITWEHLKLQELVQNIMNAYQSGVTVPAWVSGDYDSLYVVRLTRSGSTTTAQFEHDYEGLNGLPTSCP